MTRRSVPKSLLSSLAAILILAAGCADRGPTATLADGPTTPAGVSGYSKVSLPRAAGGASYSSTASVHEQIIGTEGGKLEHDRVSIVFPAGAVSEPTSITVAPGTLFLEVEFGPHGLQFPAGKEPTLTFNYDGITDLPEQDLTIYYLDSAGEVLEKLDVVVDTSQKTVSAKLRHFSQYALIAP